MTAQITALTEKKLYVMSNPYVLDGRASTHPADVRGVAPMQAYLIKEPDRALLLGTGLTMHQEAVLGQLETLLDGARLSFMPLAYDFTRLCNIRPIADRLGLEFVYQPQFAGAPAAWLNFRPEFPLDHGDALRDAEIGSMRSPIAIGDAGDRLLTLLVPPLRLLPNHWVYDESTKTLFTVDVFTWVWQPTFDGPWVITDDDDDPTTQEIIERALFLNKYWWVAGADTSRMRRALHDVFEQYDVETIAPDHGCVLTGTRTVDRHYQLLDDALAAAPHRSSIGVEVGNWRFELAS